VVKPFDPDRLTRQVIVPTAVLVAVSLAILVGLIWINARTEDEVARQQSIGTVRKALDLRMEQVGRVAKDYAWWDDAVRYLALTPDPEWADSNIGGYIFETHGIDVSLVVDGEGGTAYAAIEGERRDADAMALLGDGFDSLIRAARASSRAEPEYHTGLLRTEMGIAIVGVTALTAEETGEVVLPPGPRSVLVLVNHLNDGFLKDLGQGLDLENLRLDEVSDARSDEAALVLEAVDGGSLGALVWEPHKPGRQFLVSIAPSLVLALLVIGAFTWFVLRHAGATAAAVAASEARFRDVADASSDWIWQTDGALRLSFVSDRFTTLTGIPAAAVLGRRLDEVLRRAEEDERWEVHREALREHRPFRNTICLCEDRRGTHRTLRISGKPFFDENNVFLGYRGTATDISKEIEAERQARFLASHDSLTGLPNRLLLKERLEQAIVSVGRRRELAALILVDLNRFREINDTMGHEVGDSLIRAYGERLQAALRETDTVARIGGDEFGLIHEGLSRPEEAARLANRLLAILGQPFDIDGRPIVTTASLGIALLPTDGSLPDILLQRADIALTRAKAEGRDRFRFYEREADAKLQARKRLESALRQAIAGNELEVFFQPKVELARRQVTGAEALLRWRHGEQGYVSPSEFVPIAEETGLIVELGAWVLESACRAMRAWPGLTVAVNLSPVQLKRSDLARTVRDALEATGLDPRRLELEITESTLVEDPEHAAAILDELKSLGVRVAMDDFGTGYSSLGYLNRFDFDRIKVDRSFTMALGDRGDAAPIIRAVVAMGHSLGIEVCAEGVETEQQLRFLEQLGCDEVQGFHFGRPMPLADFGRYLEAGGAAAAFATAPS